MFETQDSRNKKNLGEIGLNKRTDASPKEGQYQVSGGESVLYWNFAPVANVLWKHRPIRLKVKLENKVQISNRNKDPISSNSQPSATANKAKHYLK